MTENNEKITKQEVAQDIMTFLQRNLYARPDKPLATMKFTAWVKLARMLEKYGAKT